MGYNAVSLDGLHQDSPVSLIDQAVSVYIADQQHAGMIGPCRIAHAVHVQKACHQLHALSAAFYGNLLGVGGKTLRGYA